MSSKTVIVKVVIGLFYLFIYYEIVHAVHIQKYMKIHIKSSTQKMVEFKKRKERKRKDKGNTHTLTHKCNQIRSVSANETDKAIKLSM